ncbi:MULTISPECIES: hypothetical protein [Streptomyces]|uniref:hypothetical protein n=1 Tax=Streptomyces TaxID=1883 RepID=UPI00117F4A10|nr:MULTISPECIES: hypothetical protein [Streptomyces]
MTPAQEAAGRIVTALGWSGSVRTVPDGAEARIVHAPQAWWLAVAVHQDAGAVQVRTGTIAEDGTHRSPHARSLPVPAEDTDALVLAVNAVREDQDGTTSWGRQHLEVAGTVWLVFDGGLSRLPLVCRRCQARTGHRLTADPAAGLAILRCTAGHITCDPRLSPDGITEAIGHHSSLAPSDIDVRGFSTR